jgi:hypothetical protein
LLLTNYKRKEKTMKTIRLINLFVLYIIQITSFAQGTLIISTNGVRYGNIDLDLIYVSPTKDITNAIIIPGANFITKTEGFGSLGYRGNSLAPLNRLLLQFGCSPGGSYNPMTGSARYYINCTGKQFVMVRYSKWSDGGVPIVLSLNNVSQSFFPVYQGSWDKFTTSEWLEFDFPPLTDVQETITNSARIYPVPCKDYIIFSLDAKENQKTNIHIFNIDGKLIKQIKYAASQATFDTSDLNTGIYIYQIKNVLRTESGTFIKQ